MCSLRYEAVTLLRIKQYMVCGEACGYGISRKGIKWGKKNQEKAQGAPVLWLRKGSETRGNTGKEPGI